MFFAFKETYKLDSQNSKITDLERKIAKLEQEVYFLGNPPKFKVGDLVIFNHTPEMLMHEQNRNYVLTEKGEFEVFVILQISKNKSQDPCTEFTKYSYTYSIIDKGFKKPMKSVDDTFLKLVNTKERKKKWL